jgi:hypothetical protein
MPATPAVGTDWRCPQMPTITEMQREDTPPRREPDRPRSPEQQHEDQVVEEKAAVGSHIVYKAIRKTADEELARPPAR